MVLLNDHKLTFIQSLRILVNTVRQTLCKQNIDLRNHGHCHIILRNILKIPSLRKVQAEDEGPHQRRRTFKQNEDYIDQSIILINRTIVAYILLFQKRQHNQHILYFFMVRHLEQNTKEKSEDYLAYEERLEVVEL